MIRVAIGLILLAVAGVFGMVQASRAPDAADVHIFADVTGPLESSAIEPPNPTDWRRFEDGSPSRLAILLSDPDSAWLGLVHGLQSIGVPFIVTDDYRRALRHRVVLVYPRISGRAFSSQSLRELAEFARTGGTLLGVNVLGGGLDELFGFSGVKGRRDHTRVRFDVTRPLTADLTDPAEAEIRIAAPDRPATQLGTHDYLDPADTPIATYEDGTAAIVERVFDSGGRACAIGFDLGLVLLKAHNRRLEGVSRQYANGFDPSADIPIRLVAALYRAGEPHALTLEPVPEGRRLAALMTHDVDYAKSISNAVVYAEHARQAGYTATFFIQTKYVRDWNDDNFFDATGTQDLARIASLGMEIASHSVAHSRVFAAFEMGSGQEAYPDYRPFVKSGTQTYGASILGELRVSRFLLEELGQSPVVSFRPGHLANPMELPQALAATGYHFSSSVTANVSLSHLPFRLNRGRGTVEESPIFEFPVTVEDELGEPLLDRLEESVELAKRIARQGGLLVVLIHPNVVGDKLVFEQRLVEAIRDFSWLGSVADYGRWWVARDAVRVDVKSSTGGAMAEITAPSRIEGLTLRLPSGLRIEGATPTSPDADTWVLGPIEGRVKLALRRRDV